MLEQIIKKAREWLNVRVGQHIPPEHFHVPELMSNILPVIITKNPAKKFKTDFKVIHDDKSLVNWYSLFETIHPYEDGNGRTGGIIIGAGSYYLYGKFLAPKQ